MSRGHEDRLRQKFDEKMRRAAEKAKAEKAAKQTVPSSPGPSPDPEVNETPKK